MCGMCCGGAVGGVSVLDTTRIRSRLYCWVDGIWGPPPKAQEHIKILRIFNVSTSLVLVFSNNC